MTANEAFAILGEPLAHYELVGLMKSLSHPSRVCSFSELEKLAAVIWALRHPDEWSRQCLWVSRKAPRTLWTPEQLKEFSL